ncbi:MAG: magnesium transporter [Gammaproteobacteria bacterium]
MNTTDSKQPPTLPKDSPDEDPKAWQDWLTQHDTVTICEELSHLEPAQRSAALLLLPPNRSVAVFEQLDTAHQQEFLKQLGSTQVRHLLEQLDPDDRARLLEQMPAAVAAQAIAELSPSEQRMTTLLLGYPEESAGRIMNPEFVRLAPDMTIAEAMVQIRQQGRFAETIYTLPVTDRSGILLGTAELEDLILAEPSARVADLMDHEVASVHVHDDQETVARLIQSADLLAVPVVNDDGRLMGMVTIDDAMDILQFEASEDLARAGAAEPLGRPYFSVSVLQVAGSRIVWLSLLAVAAILTVNVLSAFEEVLETVVTLSLFIPLLIGIGGNTGAQSATTVVRAIAINDIRVGDLHRVLLREVQVGALLGATLAALAFGPVWLFAGQPIAIVVSLTLIAICALASLVGASMPILARRIGVDPAVVSAPIVTTLVDASGLLVYFLIARAVLPI